MSSPRTSADLQGLFVAEDKDSPPDPKRRKLSPGGKNVAGTTNGPAASSSSAAVPRNIGPPAASSSAPPDLLNKDSSDDEDDDSDVDMMDLVQAAAEGEELPSAAAAAETAKPKLGIRGKRGPEARRRRILMRLERTRQEAKKPADGSAPADGDAPADRDEDMEDEGLRIRKDPIVRKHQLSKRVFVTNIDFAVSEEDLRTLFETVGEIAEIRMATDKATSKFSGYCHVTYTKPAFAAQAVERFHHHKLEGRVLTVFPAEDAEEEAKRQKWWELPSSLANRVDRVAENRQFEFPDGIQRQMVDLFKKYNYAGKNISCIKNAWEKTHGSKLDVGEYGFKNFSAAMKTSPYFRLEREAPMRQPLISISRPAVAAPDVGAGDDVQVEGAAGSSAGVEGQGAAGSSAGVERQGSAGSSAGDKLVGRKQPKGSLTFVAYLR